MFCVAKLLGQPIFEHLSSPGKGQKIVNKVGQPNILSSRSATHGSQGNGLNERDLPVNYTTLAINERLASQIEKRSIWAHDVGLVSSGNTLNA